jgi:predicted ester cyclase
MARFEFLARHTGEFMKIPPTGKDIRVTGNSLIRIENGKIAEGWDEFDLFGMLMQIEALPALDVPGV